MMQRGPVFWLKEEEVKEAAWLAHPCVTLAVFIIWGEGGLVVGTRHQTHLHACQAGNYATVLKP